MYYQELINEFTALCQQVLGDALVGIYLHGSSVMGCFNPKKSDIDLIVVVEDTITDEKKCSLMDQIVEMNERGPAKGIEISFVKREHCDPFAYPTPFELHFSSMHLQWYRNNPKEYIEKMKGFDEDLAAHFTIINHYGIRIYGKEIADVFAAVPKKDYADSIWGDIECAREDILTNTLYIVLNLCRVLAYLREDLVLSKKQGGEWGLTHLDAKYHHLLQYANECYQSDQTMQLDEALATEYVNEMLANIQVEMNKLK